MKAESGNFSLKGFDSDIAVRYGRDTEERQGFRKDNGWYQNI